MTVTKDDTEHKPFISEADWLRVGWVFKLKRGGGMDLTRTAYPKKTPAERAHAIASIVDKVIRQPDCTAVFISKEDCSLVLEYFPGLLIKTKKK